MRSFIVLLAVALAYLVDRAFFHGKYFASVSRMLSQMAAGFGLR